MSTPPSREQQQRAARRTVCDRAARGVDLQDPVQRADAVALAALLLDALGLGPPRLARMNSLYRRNVGSCAVHGTGSGVDAHREAGQPLCGACARWAEVQERRGRRAVQEPAQDAPQAGDGCGRYAAWREHLRRGEALDERCDAYARWWRSRRADGRGSRA